MTDPYRVFVSHGWHDRWLAKQMARCIREDAGADPFIDIFDIKRGDRIEDRIADELPKCDELIALLTPWSISRHWIWNEIGAAWILRKRVVGILYGITLDDLDKGGGRACLTSRNVAALDEFDDYLVELKDRVGRR